jgi:hypothetical protein
MLCLDALGERAKLGKVHTMIVAMALVGRAHLRVFECGKLAHDVLDCCARCHDAPFAMFLSLA